MAHSVGEDRVSAKGEQSEEGTTATSDSELVRFRVRLRERWELASVLNFINVFEPVIGMDLKFSAEEIETGLVKPDKLISNLHIKLLKGIPPVSKTLDGPDAWVTVVCKKLATWWPWVAEGELPLTASKGEEIFMYKELDPTTRLQILKALCELRADQDDIVSYINDAIKSGTHVSCFRKDKIGGDGNGTAYWYDGSVVTGHRLYKEVSQFEAQAKHKGKGCLTLPNFLCYQWETLATNLEEFRGVVDKFSSSVNKMEVSVGRRVESDVIPTLEKLQKKEGKALKQKQRREMLLNGFQNSYRAGYTRSCRNRKPVNYTYDDYDQAIKEAIQVAMKHKASEQPVNEGSQGERKRRSEKFEGGICGSDADINIRESSITGDSSMESDTYNEKFEGGCNNEDDSDDDYNGERDNINVKQTESSSGSEKNDGLGQMNQASHPTGRFATKPVGSYRSKRLAGISSHSTAEVRNMGAKNRLRQRPIRNTALETMVVPDSDDGNSAGNLSSGTMSPDSPARGPDSEDVSHSN